MHRRHYLDQQELLGLFNYDTSTGQLTRKVNSYSGRNNAKIQAKAGDVAGTVNKSTGYVVLRVNGRITAAHLVVWVMHYGYTPEHDIDHINRDKTDNRLCNLREATRSCNIKNRPILANNTSGINGVSYARLERKWKSYITVLGKKVPLGTFASKLQASSYRYCAELLLKWESCVGESKLQQFLMDNNYWPIPEKDIADVYSVFKNKQIAI